MRAGITFQPTINERSRSVDGRLRILEDPETYVARLAAEAAVATERANRAAAEAAVSEMAECTFRPQVSPQPATCVCERGRESCVAIEHDGEHAHFPRPLLHHIFA